MSPKQSKPPDETTGIPFASGPFPFALPWHDWNFLERKTDETKVLREFGPFILSKKIISPATPITFENEEALNSEIKKAKTSLAFLVKLAKQGHHGAAEGLVSVVGKACAELSHLVKTDLALFRPIAHKRFKWPLMKSRNPIFGNSDDLLKDLELGKSLPLEIHECARGKRDNAGMVALHLLTHVWQYRKNPPMFYDDALRSSITALDNFNDNSKADWWKVAKKCFLCSYPKPETIPDLDELITIPTHRKSPGVIRFRILDKIKQRFLSLAPAIC